MIYPNGTITVNGGFEVKVKELGSTIKQLFHNLSENSRECLFSIVCACNNKSLSMLSMQILMLSPPISKLISTYDCFLGAEKELRQKPILKTENEVSV